MLRKLLRKEEEGSILVLTSLGMVVVLGFVGLAVDVGNLRLAKRNLQSAVDAAALAAALEVTTCGTTPNCTTMQTAAQSAMAENGFSGVTLLAGCTGAAGSGVTITVNNPPCAQGASDPNSGKNSYVEVIATECKPTYFASILGFHSFAIGARAEAGKTSNPNCIYALDPSGGNAITVDLLATVNSACGVVDESNAWNALSCNLIASLSASQVNVTGGTEGFLCLLPSSTPNTGVAVPTPADPLAYLPKPAVPSCGSSTGSPYHGSSLPVVITVLSGPTTLYPDASYCQGITIAAAANGVTFMPGTYVIKSGGLLGAQGGMTISLLANVSGTGVTFYNYGPKGGISFAAASVNLGTVSLTAPTTGTYAGILFFQDPQNSDPALILGSTAWNTSLEGAYYFPSATVTYAASLVSKYNILVAKDITFALLTFGSTNLKSSFANDYTSLPNGSPLEGGGSVMVQ